MSGVSCPCWDWAHWCVYLLCNFVVCKSVGCGGPKHLGAAAGQGCFGGTLGPLA